MSKETMTWLNNNTLIGFTEKRGNAWHYRASEQGDESNHYVGPVPIEDVRRRLFFWKPVEGTIESTYITEDGVTRVTDPERKAIIRPDTRTMLGIFKQGFQIHDYDEWLLVQTQMIADSELGIASAGLLKGGAVAWVQFELPETIESCGVEFRPFLTGATSLDGSMASTYQTGTIAVVCDNTLGQATADKSHQVKIKHSTNSLGRIGEVRNGLGMVYAAADNFIAELEELTTTAVSASQWQKFLDAYAPVDYQASKRSVTMAEKKREEVARLYHSDNRAAQWKGTAYGVLAAANTWETHFQTVRGTNRVERNALNMVTGQHHKNDQAILDTLHRVLVNA